MIAYLRILLIALAVTAVNAQLVTNGTPTDAPTSSPTSPPTSEPTSAPTRAPNTNPAPTRAPVQLVNAAPVETTIVAATANTEVSNALVNLVPGGPAALPADAQAALANVGFGADSAFNVGSNLAQGGIAAGAQGIFPPNFLTGGLRHLRGEAGEA
jgi:hypothetical protein